MTGSRTGWVDATGGVSGDMLLGACLGAGARLDVVQAALDRLELPERIEIATEHATRCGLAAVRAVVRVPESGHRRTLPDMLGLLHELPHASAVFEALAAAEARVHGVPIEQVHFHEVGALDSIADVVAVTTALADLGVDRLISSPIALGAGQAHTEHGPIPVPGPAVVELLRARGAPGFGGPIATELATPTGVALLAVLADEFGPLPSLRPVAVGIGAGRKDPAGHPNVTRLIIGEPVAADSGAVTAAVVLEANVDDLDPRLWPQVLTDLLAAGASDAWLTPIMMKKGRPAHTLSVLTDSEREAALERAVFALTSTIGLRRRVVEKVTLARDSMTVPVYGGEVRVKVARIAGEVVNAEPEFEDVVRLAAELGRPVKTVLAAARAAALHVQP